MSRPLITKALAEYAAAVSWRDLPPGVRREAERSVANWVGCAIGGSDTRACDAAVRALAKLSSERNARLFGRDERLDLSGAAIVNGLASAVYAFDDTHIETITHPTGPVAAAMFAVVDAERVACAGSDFLTALAIGSEIQLRLSVALRSSPAWHTGWWMTGISGTIGAAIALSKLLNLSLNQTISALGIATNQSAGLRSTHQSMTSPLTVGLAARNAIAAVYLAQAGFQANCEVLEGRNGLFDIIANGAEVSGTIDRLGRTFVLTELCYKPYPGAIVCHSAIDAALQVHSHPEFDVSEIEEITVVVHPAAANLAPRRLPSTVFEAQHSLTHWVAAGLTVGRAGLSEMADGFLRRTDIRRLQEHMLVRVSDELAIDQAVVTVRLASDSVIEASVDHCFGSSSNPLSDDDLRSKFMLQVTPLIGSARGESLWQQCIAASTLPDVRTLLDRSGRS